LQIRIPEFARLHKFPSSHKKSGPNIWLWEMGGCNSWMKERQ